MKVTMTADFKRVVFTWNADLTNVGYVGVNVSDTEIDALIAANGHEGAEVTGWKTTIE